MITKESIEQSLRAGIRYEEIINSAITASEFEALRDYFHDNPNPAAQEYLKEIVKEYLFTAIMIGNNPLIGLDRKGLDNITKLIKLNIVDINATNKNGETLLMAGSYSRTITNALLDVPGIDVNIRDKDGFTAFMRVMTDDSLSFDKSNQITEMLANHGAKLEPRDTLIMYVRNPQRLEERSRRMLYSKIDYAQTPAEFKHIRDSNYDHPIPGLQEHLKEAVTNKLFRDINSSVGGTLDAKVMANFVEIIGLGIADINSTNGKGETLLMLGSFSRTITKALLNVPGIDVNKRDNNGWTAAMYIAANERIDPDRSIEILTMLKQRGATISVNDIKILQAEKDLFAESRLLNVLSKVYGNENKDISEALEAAKKDLDMRTQKAFVAPTVEAAAAPAPVGAGAAAAPSDEEIQQAKVNQEVSQVLDDVRTTLVQQNKEKNLNLDESKISNLVSKLKEKLIDVFNCSESDRIGRTLANVERNRDAVVQSITNAIAASHLATGNAMDEITIAKRMSCLVKAIVGIFDTRPRPMEKADNERKAASPSDKTKAMADNAQPKAAHELS